MTFSSAVRAPVRNPQAAAAADVRLEERRRAAFEDPVGEQLDGGRPDVWRMGGGTLRDERRDAAHAHFRFEPLRDDGAQAELSGAVEAVVGRDRLRPGVRLGQRHDAEAVRLGDGEPQPREPLRRGGLGQKSADELRRALAQGADRHTGGVALDPAAHRIRSGSSEAGELQCFRVHPGRVAVGRAENRRAVGEDRVEVAAVGDAAREECQVPAAAEQPGTVAERGRAGPEAAEDLGAVATGVEIAAGELDAALERVGVPVVEAGEDEAPAELHHSRLGSDESDNLPIGADEDQPVASHGNRLGPAAGGIHSVDPTVPKDEVGRDAAPRRRASGGQRNKKRTGKGGRGERDGSEMARQTLPSRPASAPALRAPRPARVPRETHRCSGRIHLLEAFSSASSLPDWGPSRC